MGDVYSFEIERDVLNQKLGGGFPCGSLALIEGDSGTGKSITCQRICFGLLENDVSVTFISAQLTTKGFISQMQTLDYPIARYLLNGKLLFIPVLPLLQGTKSRSNFIQRLMAAKTLFEKDVIIIDTISSLISHSADIEKVLDLINFFKRMGSVKKTIILALDMDMLDPDIMHIFDSSSDICLLIKTKREMENIRHSIVVNKFAGSEIRVTQIIGFQIEYWCPTHRADDQRLRILYTDLKNEACYER
ncbi:MAG: ATPase domain-containing protein [Euryarchaeota archaeon]|nr:ATPase domain-containing protein [Euryarchaeota archaeon]